MAAGAILFDLDGTLWDSLPWYATILSEGDADRLNRLLVRLRTGASVVTLASEQGLNKGHLVRRCRNDAGALKLFPSVKGTLRELWRRGVPMGVVTSLSGDIATAMLEGADLMPFFPVIVHPGNCRSGKASGIPLGRALRRLDIAPSENVFYVGDREDDAAGARACGVSFAWASFGYGGKPRGKCTVLQEFKEVLGL